MGEYYGINVLYDQTTIASWLAGREGVGNKSNEESV
jgi:hypothetical protein